MVDRRALNGANLSTKVFKKMINLRVLKIDDLHISGDFELLSKELRWLSWKKCSLKCIPSNFPAEKLVVLDMQGSNTQEFGLNMQYCRSLKELNLSNCKRLRRTPNFNGSQSLETLRLQNCSRLTEIHPSMGNLIRLIVLDLCECKRLTELPSSICHLKSLKSLDILGSSLQTLPVDLGDLRGLNSLLASYTGIKQLPVSIEMLTDLITLEVGSLYLEDKRSFSRRKVHHIQSLPTFLSSLVLRYCGFSEVDIPRDIGSLSFLRNLDLSGNNFLYLPFDFSKLPFLMSLRLNNCEILQTLPSLSNLICLRDLEIANCEKLVKITELDNLPSIQKINMVNCSSLQNPFKEGFFSAPALALSYLGISIDLQSNEIPDWCSNRITTSSICFSMPTHNKKYKFLGMILWCVRYSGPWDGWEIIIDRKMSSIFHWQYGYEICTGHTEVSCYNTELT